MEQPIIDAPLEPQIRSRHVRLNWSLRIPEELLVRLRRLIEPGITKDSDLARRFIADGVALEERRRGLA